MFEKGSSSDVGLIINDAKVATSDNKRIFVASIIFGDSIQFNTIN